MQPTSGGLLNITTIALAGLLASPAWAQDEGPEASTSCASAGPCFSKVDDILGGQRHLLASDDLMVSVGTSSGPGDRDTTYINYPFHTKRLIPTLQPVGASIATTSCTTPSGVPTSTSSQPAPLATRLGRVYNLKNDVVVTSVWTIPTGEHSCSQTIFVTEPDGTVLHEVGNAISPEPRMAVFDADLDGFDDIFMINAANMTFHSPDDVNDPGSDLVFRYVQSFMSDAFTPRGDPVTGDFNSDGAVDIAWLGAADGGEVEIQLASVCAAEGQHVLNHTCTQSFEIVLAHKIIPTGQTWIARNGEFAGRKFEQTFPRMGLAAGDFWGDPDPETGIAADELVLILLEEGKGNALAFAWSFTEDLTPTLENAGGTPLTDSDFFPVPVDFFYPVGNPPFVTAGRLDWDQRNEQVVAAWSAYPWYGIWVATFTTDQNGNVSIGINAELIEDVDTNVRIRGVAIGRFDPPDPELQPLGPEPELDFNQQVAVLYTEESASDGSDPRTLIDIYRVDPPDDFQPVRFADARTVFLDAIPFRNELPVPAPLQAGDLQGRSLRLGAPIKLTVMQTQADVIVGLPPMHIDYITPPEGADPEIYNVSAFPNTSSATFVLENTSSDKGSRQSTTSYTYATSESAEEHVSYGVPDIASVSLDAKQSATQKHGSTVSSSYSSFTSKQFNMKTTTQFADSVSSTTSRLNIWSYPVIGHTACPIEAGAGCSEDDQAPLHVQFSGPDTITNAQPAPGYSLEWYQPVHEPGNLFSYPGSLTQLEANLPPPAKDSASRFQELSSGGGTWDSGANNTVSLTWASGSTSGTTAGSVSNHSFDASVSASASVSIGGFGAGASGSFDYNKSKSVSTLNTKTVSLAETTGATLALSSQTSDNPLYDGESYIFGVTPPAGTIQDIEQTTDVQANGVLTIGSTVAPQAKWWFQMKAYGGAPDVALNHPQRWQDNGGTVSFNCPVQNAFEAGFVCPNLPNPSVSDYSNAQFYDMKGLFVIPGDIPRDAASGPPTTRTMISGESFTLRARIYNYSFVAADTVHVAFYAQPASQNAGFLSKPGQPDVFEPAVSLGPPDVLDGIPAFCGNSCDDAPRNWSLAQVTFDTTVLGPPPAGGTSYWNFWVVTWMEDGSGALVNELPGHGLVEIPASDLTSPADVSIEAFSNNLGVYPQVFALISADDAGAGAELLAAAPEPAATRAPELAIKKVSVKPKRRLRGENPTVQATLHTNQAQSDVLVRFFAGDPADDGVLFDMEMVPYIPADEPYVVAVAYQPGICDARRVYVEAVAVDLAPAEAHTHRRIRPDVSCLRAER